MKVRAVNERVIEIEFDDSELQLLKDIEIMKMYTPEELVESSLTETMRLASLTSGAEKKLRKAVAKFNEENKTQIGIDDMRRLVHRSGL